jgi:hypothetical protein
MLSFFICDKIHEMNYGALVILDTLNTMAS